MTEAAPRFSVIVPSRGDPAKLGALAEALARQTLPWERFEIIVALDGVDVTPQVRVRLNALAARLVFLEQRSGPGAARNRAAEVARGEFLAFTEDDVSPEPDWLERAQARLDADPTLDVLEGATLKPGGRAVRVRAAAGPPWLAINLFVRRALFERVGGYHESYFDAGSGLYFREDSDLGFALEDAGARRAEAPDARVTHPDEHPRPLDALRWARRYEMDALLAARHPRFFRDRIEVHQLGPFRIRRPIVRASVAYVLCVVTAALLVLFGRRGEAAIVLLLAAVAFVPVWAKWRCDPRRLLVTLVVPFVLVWALARGAMRVRSGALR